MRHKPKRNTCHKHRVRQKKNRSKPIQSVRIFGKYKNRTLPVQTDKKGRLLTISNVRVTVDCGFTFKETKRKVKTADEFAPLPLEDIRYATQYVYAVRNLGDADGEVKIQIGPDPKSLADDIGPERIPANETKIVTPLRFSKFIRLLYRSAEPGKKTKLLIVFQAQIQK